MISIGVLGSVLLARVHEYESKSRPGTDLPVNIVKVDAVYAESLQRLLAALPDIGRVAPGIRSVASDTKLCCNKNVVALSGPFEPVHT